MTTEEKPKLLCDLLKEYPNDYWIRKLSYNLCNGHSHWHGDKFKEMIDIDQQIECLKNNGMNYSTKRITVYDIVNHFWGDATIEEFNNVIFTKHDLAHIVDYFLDADKYEDEYDLLFGLIYMTSLTEDQQDLYDNACKIILKTAIKKGAHNMYDFSKLQLFQGKYEAKFHYSQI